jgi:hypothetical protein
LECENEKATQKLRDLRRKRKTESEDDGYLPGVSTKRRATLAYFKEKHRNDLDIKQ